MLPNIHKKRSQFVHSGNLFLCMLGAFPYGIVLPPLTGQVVDTNIEF